MEEGDRAAEWGDGLPALEELMPLTQSLITPDLASAFSITQEETAAFLGEVQFATQSTFDSVGPLEHLSPLEAHLSLQRNHNSNCVPQLRPEIGLASSLIDGKEIVPETGLVGQGPSTLLYGNSPGHGDGSPLPSCMTFNALERIDNGCGVDTSESSKKPRKQLDTEFEDGESGGGLENSSEEPTARTLKRPRLVWTPQLHKRFVDAVAHLGIKNAVPKTIMQLMNVEGLTRENVASHLQKYRLYLKRMQGLSSDGPSVSDQLFASTPIPPSLAASAHFLSNHNRRDDIVPLMVPVPIAALGHGHMVGTLGAAAPYPGFDHHIYNAFARSSTHTFSSGDEDSVMENQGRSRSPQRRVLTLFPTNGH